jgi:hypothetical protein
VTGQLAGQADGYLVGLDQDPARRARADVGPDPLATLRREFIAQEVEQLLDQFAAGNHAGTSSK